jgi:hypothetical protein
MRAQRRKPQGQPVRAQVEVAAIGHPQDFDSITRSYRRVFKYSALTQFAIEPSRR